MTIVKIVEFLKIFFTPSVIVFHLKFFFFFRLSFCTIQRLSLNVKYLNNDKANMEMKKKGERDNRK